MKKIFKVIAFSFGVSILGCQSIDVLDQENSASYSNYSDLTFTELDKMAKYEFDITSSTQRLTTDSIDSPVIGVDLPKNKTGITVLISSEINMGVFAPNIMFLNDEWQPVASVDFDEFEYQRPETYQGDALVYEFEINSIEHRDYSHMVIFTTDEDLNSFSRAIHPARLKAEMRDEVLDIDDIKVRHSEYGEITITLESISLDSEESKQRREENAKSEDYYFEQINKFVNEGNIEEALRVRDEAKFYGIEGADEAFSKALKNSSNQS
ncbi:MalM family protein [Vibrio superstes]|uniref:Maltose operon protein n=1 Tax=Vibrio superstes NBRC 103154 TaxID=1219062 RepID=A0A511QP75_9VIBR|nr:MalM family protein [Vibrio superstes]GEM79125.1 hypothetical protein VSU01S_13700 [Vibrio superstes NBRC 103154]